MAPLWEDVGAFAKVGGAWLNTEFNGGGSIDNFNVTYGAGLYYEVNDDWSVEGGWQRYHGDQEFFGGSFQPMADFYYAGLTYKFPVDMF